MRIALMCLDKVSAQALFAYHIAKELVKLAEVKCFLSEYNSSLDDFRKLPCEVQDFKWSRGMYSLFWAALTGRDTTGISKAILDFEPDILLNTNSFGWSRVIYRKLAGKTYIAEMVHDVTPHPGRKQKIIYLYEKLYPSYSDAVIGISDYSYKLLKEKYPNKKCISSKHGIFFSNENFNPDKIASLRNKFLFLGRIEPYKGISTLLDAYAIAKSKRENINLSIVGLGEVTTYELNMINKLGVQFINRYVSDEEVNDLISSHGILVLPYTSATQSGVAAIALGYGLPCIASNVGALPEQIKHNESGLIVPPGNPEVLANAMIQLSDDEYRVKSMAQKAYDIGRNEYNWGNIVKDLYNDLKLAIDNREQS